MPTSRRGRWRYTFLAFRHELRPKQRIEFCDHLLCALRRSPEEPGERDVRRVRVRTNVSDRFGAMIAELFFDDATAKSQMALIRDFDTEVVDALREVHSRLTMPTLFVWGEDDPFFPAEMAKAMTAQFAGPTTFEVIPDAKLFVHEERPAQFTQLTRKFLEEHAGGLRRP